MMTRRLPLLGAVIVMTAAAACSSSTDGDVTVQASTVSNDVTGDISVWNPSDGGPYPVVLLLHEREGDRADVATLGAALAESGLTVFAPTWTRPRQQLYCFYVVAGAAASGHRGDSSRPITMVGHGDAGPYAIGSVIYETGTGDPAQCVGDAAGDMELPDAPTLAVALAPCPFDGEMSGLRDGGTVVVVSADGDERCRPDVQAGTVELLDGAGMAVSLVTISEADHWSISFQTRRDNGEIVSDPDSSAGAEVVRVIADAIADASE